MKFLIPVMLLFPRLVLAVNDATILAIDSRALLAKSNADDNDNRIQALEAEDVILNKSKGGSYHAKRLRY